jgi:hypothetical protein
MYPPHAPIPKRKRPETAAVETHTWLTPPEILAALGGFDLDPCACPAPRPWSTADVMWTREDGPLRRDWPAALRVWLNPPFGPPPLVRAFMARMAEHQHGTALLFARTETQHFQEYVWKAASAVLFVKGRMRFYRQDGSLSRNCPAAPTVLIAYGARDANRLAECGISGAFVPLRKYGWAP